MAGSGFVGQTAHLLIEYDRAEPGAPASLFAKLSSASPQVREQMRRLGLYETEAGFYRDLAALDDFPVRIPRPYLSLYEETTGASVLLIEDLGKAQFCDNVAGSSPEEALGIVRQMALLHAHFWNDPRLKAFAWLRSPAADTAAFTAVYKAMLAPFEQRFSAMVSPYYLNAAKEFSTWTASFLYHASQLPTTLFHGDLRLDNVAIASNHHGPEIVFFDWQVSRLAHGAADLAYYMAISLPVEQRRAMEPELLNTYHETLLANGVTSYSHEDLLLDFRRGLGSPLRTAVVAGGMLDFSSERGQQLIQQLSLRIGAMLEDHRFTESLEELFPPVPES